MFSKTTFSLWNLQSFWHWTHSGVSSRLLDFFFVLSFWGSWLGLLFGLLFGRLFLTLRVQLNTLIKLRWVVPSKKLNLICLTVFKTSSFTDDGFFKEDFEDDSFEFFRLVKGSASSSFSLFCNFSELLSISSSVSTLVIFSSRFTSIISKKNPIY